MGADNSTSFEIDLPVVGQAGLDAAAKSVDVLAARLDRATKAVKAQNDAYKVAETTANAAAKALERVSLAIDAQREKLKLASDAGNDKGAAKAAAALRALVDRQAEAAKKAADAKVALESEAKALDTLKSRADAAEKAVERAKETHLKLAPALEKASKAAKEFRKDFEEANAALLGAVGAVVGAVAAVALLTAGFIAGVVGIAAWAVKLAEARRETELLAQGMVQSVQGGKDLAASVRAVSKELPVSTEQLTELAAGFAYAGYRGQNLTNALRQSAELAARLKFGPDFKKEMLSLNEQSKVFHANMSNVFGGLKIEGLLTLLQKLTALLDDTTESGRAIKIVFESIFQPLIDKVAESKFKIERFFLQLEVWALQALIAIKPFGHVFVQLGETLLVLAAIVAGAVTSAFAVLAVAAAAVASSIYRAYQVAKLFVELGTNIVSGIVEGIKNAGPAILEALKGAVMSAIDGVKSILKIHSPSQLMADEVGFQMGAGAAQGVDRSAPAVRDSLEAAVATPAPGSISGPASAGASKTISGNHFTFNGVKDAEDAEVRFGELMTRLLEGDAAQLGGAVPEPA